MSSIAAKLKFTRAWYKIYEKNCSVALSAPYFFLSESNLILHNITARARSAVSETNYPCGAHTSGEIPQGLNCWNEAFVLHVPWIKDLFHGCLLCTRTAVTLVEPTRNILGGSWSPKLVSVPSRTGAMDVKKTHRLSGFRTKRKPTKFVFDCQC